MKKGRHSAKLSPRLASANSDLLEKTGCGVRLQHIPGCRRAIKPANEINAAITERCKLIDCLGVVSCDFLSPISQYVALGWFFARCGSDLCARTDEYPYAHARDHRE
jgi:hypothetical protein